MMDHLKTQLRHYQFSDGLDITIFMLGGNVFCDF